MPTLGHDGNLTLEHATEGGGADVHAVTKVEEMQATAPLPTAPVRHSAERERGVKREEKGATVDEAIDLCDSD
jgi:hypothetical protein